MHDVKTEKGALLIGEELWRWLANNPSKDKWEWIGWEVHGGEYAYIIHDCPCCESAGESSRFSLGRDCSKCPITWSGDDEGRVKGDVAPCCSPNSPFLKWRNSTGKTRAKYAKQIADLHWEKLQELGKEEKAEEAKGDTRRILINGFSVAYLGIMGDNLSISAHWLREAGFRGDVTIYNGQHGEDPIVTFHVGDK